jgi:fructose-bisphosphate aldolase class II
MALITLRQLLDHAAENGYGLPAFNVNNMEQVLAIMRAADSVQSPAILQVSRGARSYAGDPMVKAMIHAALEMFPGVPVCLHQDHGNSFETCQSAIDQGYTSAMMDGSLLDDASTPSSYEYNVDITKKAADYAHARGVSVEGELGVLGRLDTGEGEKEDGHGAVGKLDRSQLLTDPDQAVDFVSKTQVDALAIAMGTSHGAYKFSQKPDSSVLAMSVVREIHERLPDLHLVMHGSSSVPQDLQDIFNEFGGELPQTYGVPVEEILEGIQHGVRKVNIDTDLRLAMTGAYRKVAQTKKQEFDPRKFNIPAMEAVTDLCRTRYEQFGSAGQAPKIQPVAPSDMARRYAAGELDQRVAG